MVSPREKYQTSLRYTQAHKKYSQSTSLYFTSLILSFLEPSYNLFFLSATYNSHYFTLRIATYVRVVSINWGLSTSLWSEKNVNWNTFHDIKCELNKFFSLKFFRIFLYSWYNAIKFNFFSQLLTTHTILLSTLSYFWIVLYFLFEFVLHFFKNFGIFLANEWILWKVDFPILSNEISHYFNLKLNE